MGRWLNRYLFILFVLLTTYSVAQDDETEYNTADYKNRQQFERFYKRRITIGAWQINQLKAGALVVRLKTNHLLLKELKKAGNLELAEKKRLENEAINLNIIRSYLNRLDFCKVYFIYSNSSDSLLKGKRENIFLDSNLRINPEIKMTENFYLLAESDRAYNSSIGFVPEDSARKVFEAGNPTGGEYPIVLKNKYGHQLKKPFPYIGGNKLIATKSNFLVFVTINGIPIPFNVGEIFNSSDNKVFYEKDNMSFMLTIPKMYTYEVFSLHVEQFNQNLYQYFQANPPPHPRSVLYQEAKPFLY